MEHVLYHVALLHFRIAQHLARVCLCRRVAHNERQHLNRLPQTLHRKDPSDHG